MEMAEICLLLGSNLGDREAYLDGARKLITQKVGKIQRISSLYLTQSWGNTAQPDFINQVVEVESHLSPRQLLKEILAIEVQLGRKREEKWGARTIDVDILFYDDYCVNDEDLIIPHPFLHQRRFTLIPLMELNPERVHPVLKKTIRQLYENLSDDLMVKQIKK